MNRTVATFLMLAFFALFIAEEVAKLKRWAWQEDFTLIAASFCITFAHIRTSLTPRKTKATKLKLGSETLPPAADIAFVIVDGIPISDTKKNILLGAMAKSKRASTSGKLLQEIPFLLQDRWGGTWDFLAYEDDQRNRGFSINRVYYSGPSAQLVAECVGLRR
jgi:uncharacterized membrane protein